MDCAAGNEIELLVSFLSFLSTLKGFLLNAYYVLY